MKKVDAADLEMGDVLGYLLPGAVALERLGGWVQCHPPTTTELIGNLLGPL